MAGLDASERLIQAARARVPDAEFTVGDMFALPFHGGDFDVVTSFNGIWSGCEAALVEARRVVRPGGRFGMTFWGSLKRLGLMPYFVTVAVLSPPSHAEATIDQGGTGRPRHAEAMLQDSGLRVDSLERNAPDEVLSGADCCEGGTVQDPWDELSAAATA